MARTVREPRGRTNKLLYVLFGWLLLSSFEPRSMDELAGVVVDRTTGNPVYGAGLLLEGEGVQDMVVSEIDDGIRVPYEAYLEKPRARRYTDSLGAFRFGSLPIGSYRLTVSCPSYRFRFGRVLARREFQVPAADRHPDLTPLRVDADGCADPSPASVDGVFEGRYALIDQGMHGVGLEFAACTNLAEYLPDPDMYPAGQVAWTDFLADTLFYVGEEAEVWRPDYYVRLEGTLEGPVPLATQDSLLVIRPRVLVVSPWTPIPRYEFILRVRRVLEFRPVQPGDCD
jgi:hypothetical protein